MKLSRRQKRILKRKLKRIAGDAVAVLVGAGMFVGLLIAWANEPMPDWSEYIEENHIGMVQVEGSDTWLTQEEYEQMCKERDAYRAAEQAEEQSYYNAILQSTETSVPTTTAAIGSLDWDADDSYRLAKIAMAEAEGEDTEGKALVILVVLNRVWSDEFPRYHRGSDHGGHPVHSIRKRQIRQGRAGHRLLPGTGNGAGRTLG